MRRVLRGGAVQPWEHCDAHAALCAPRQSLLHGEIGFEAFVRVLQQVSIPPRAKFVDLGSGCGMAVLAVRTALLHPCACRERVR